MSNTGRHRGSTKCCRWRLVMAAVLVSMVLGLSWSAAAYDVDDVYIEGNESFSDRQLKKLMRTRGSSWYRKRPLIRRDLEIDLASIEAHYHKNGFLDCEVTAEEEFPEEEGMVTIRLRVQEGDRTFIRGLSFQGNERLSREHLSRGLASRVGQPLDLSLLRADIKTMEDKYGDVGYPYARIEGDVSRQGPQADVVFTIAEGSAVRVGAVEYIGLQKVKKFVVRRELTIRKDDLYDRKKMIDSRQRVNSTGLFSYVNVRLQRSEGDSLRPQLAVMVQERPMRWIGLRTEVGQDEQYDLTSDLTAEWGHRNLFGTARKLSLESTATFRIITEYENLKNRFQLTYTEPWFLGRRMPAWIDLYYEPGLKSKGRSYRVQRFGGEFNISREMGRFSRMWLALHYEKVDIFGLEPEVAEVLRLAQGEKIRRKISLSWERDSRDDIFQPGRGSLTQCFSEITGGALGGDDHYIKMVVTWNRYQGFLKSTILASRVRLGWAREYGPGEEVPPDVRFYAGGANTIRGMLERSLGPLDPLGNPLGGDGLVLFNVELRRGLWRRLGGSLFVDAGNVWAQPSKVSFGQLHATTGMELWLTTPVGPIRVAGGWQLREKMNKTKGRAHVAILFAF